MEYLQSKTANALFAVALDRRGAAHDVRALAVHPGRIITDLARYLTDGRNRNRRGQRTCPGRRGSHQL